MPASGQASAVFPVSPQLPHSCHHPVSESGDQVATVLRPKEVAKGRSPSVSS